MLRVWLDILTPKQALFFASVRKLLKEHHHEVLTTTRVYREAVQTLRLKKVPFKIVGRHGGKTREGKLLASTERIQSLTRVIENYAPDVVLSFSSVEAARVSFGLGIPHIMVNDSPHSWMVARLTIPLSRYVGSPWIIPSRVWKQYGARDKGIFRYRALDPAAWLKDFHPSPSIINQLHLSRKKPIIVLRTEEAFASYIADRSSDKEPVIAPVIQEIIRSKLDVQIIVSTRYGRQAPVLRKRFGHEITVIDKIVDATSLLYYSSMFIGSGGTMTVEAVLQGRPAISCFPGEKPLYITYLEKQKLLQTIHDPKRVVTGIRRFLDSEERREIQRRRGLGLLNWMENPSRKIFTYVVKGAKGGF